MELIEGLAQIQTETPADKIIRQIREMISSGQLSAGDRLPSERSLCQRLDVSRTHLRAALRKLEFYGILKTYPQSGTVVAGMGLPALKGLMSDMLDLHQNDFKSLVETRVILESNAAMLAAMHRSDKDLVELESALGAHREKVRNRKSAVEEDLLFHLKIADASKNSVLKSLMLIITPDVMAYFKKYNVCGEGRAEIALKQHEVLLKHIRDGDAEAAGALVRVHLRHIVDYVNTPDLIIERM